MFNPFSGEEKQKILIIRSLLSNVDLILFDEITSSLDKKSTIKFYGLLKNYCDMKTFICVTHWEEEWTFFDTIINISD